MSESSSRLTLWLPRLAFVATVALAAGEAWLRPASPTSALVWIGWILLAAMVAFTLSIHAICRSLNIHYYMPPPLAAFRGLTTTIALLALLEARWAWLGLLPFVVALRTWLVDYDHPGPPQGPRTYAPVSRPSEPLLEAHPADEEAREQPGARYPFRAFEPDAFSGKLGFVDRQGRIVIEPLYWTAGRFSEGLVMVQDRGTAFLSESGRVEFRLDLANEETNEFSEGLIVVSLLGGRFGIVDRAGRVVSAVEAAALPEQLSAGRALFQAKSESKSAGLWGYLGPDGAVAIEPQLDEARSFSEGLAAARKETSGGSGWGFMDPSGAWVVEPTLGEVRDFSEGLALVPKVGFLRPDGELELAFESIGVEARGSFHDGRAQLVDGSLHGYMDRSGAVVIDPQYSTCADFSEGRATVETADGLGIIDVEGGWIVEPGAFDQIGSYRSGLAEVRLERDRSAPRDKDGGTTRWHAYIDREGQEVFRWFTRRRPPLPI